MNLVKRYKKRGELVWFIDIPKKLAGKRVLRMAAGQTRALAEQEARQCLARILDGKQPFETEHDCITVREFVGEEGKFTKLYRPKFKPSTAQRYRDLDGQFLLPLLGDHKLNEIDTQTILRAHAALKAKELVPKGPLVYLRTVLNAAVECGELARKPEWPKGIISHAKKLPSCPTDADVERYLEGAKAGKWWFRVALNLAVFGGLRSGEIRALRVQDIDFDKNVLHVRRAMSGNEETGTKSDAERKIPIAAPLLPILREACRMKLPAARVCANDNGATPSRTHVLTALRSLQRRLGMEETWTFHSLRHYFVTAARRGVMAQRREPAHAHVRARWSFSPARPALPKGAGAR